jgi:NAD(P)-dependent dehydrogenase (short-subunit alcohol dehydrogenase family)
MFELKGKVAVITGSGSGIGKAIALLFAKQEAEVHLMDMNGEAVKATAEEIEKGNGKAIPHVCDVTSQQQVKELFNSIGKIDILVNSAGVSHIGTVETTGE